MKFISKQSNYRVVLRPGIPREPLAGQPGKPAIYAKFEDGIVNVENEEYIKLMRLHPAYGRDFIEATDDMQDPYQLQRKPIEPQHDVIEVNYGHVGKNLNPKPPIRLNSDQMRIVKEMAVKMATDMVKELAGSAQPVQSQPAPVQTAAPVAAPETPTPKAPGQPAIPKPLTAPEPIEEDEVGYAPDEKGKGADGQIQPFEQPPAQPEPAPQAPVQAPAPTPQQTDTSGIPESYRQTPAIDISQPQAQQPAQAQPQAEKLPAQNIATPQAPAPQPEPAPQAPVQAPAPAQDPASQPSSETTTPAPAKGKGRGRKPKTQKESTK